MKTLLLFTGRTVPENDCYIQFISSNATATFSTALLAFYIPVAVMIILNWKVYRENIKQQEYRKTLRPFDAFSRRKNESMQERYARNLLTYIQTRKSEMNDSEIGKYFQTSSRSIIYVSLLFNKSGRENIRVRNKNMIRHC